MTVSDRISFDLVEPETGKVFHRVELEGDPSEYLVGMLLDGGSLGLFVIDNLENSGTRYLSRLIGDSYATDRQRGIDPTTSGP